MGALRTAVDNLITKLQDPTVRAAVAAIDPKWPGVFDDMITKFQNARAAIPNNDRLDQLTPAQAHSIDVALTNTIDELKVSQDLALTTLLPPDQLYNVLDLVGDIRDACRQIAGFA